MSVRRSAKQDMTPLVAGRAHERSKVTLVVGAAWAGVLAASAPPISVSAPRALRRTGLDIGGSLQLGGPGSWPGLRPSTVMNAEGATHNPHNAWTFAGRRGVRRGWC